MSIAFDAPESRWAAPSSYGLRLDASSTRLFSSPWIHCAFLVMASLFLFVYGIHQGDLYRTEGLRAIIGKEMYTSGDWLVPRLYGEPILTKPPLFYWSIAATGSILGEVTVWSSRLPAALAGMVAIFIVYFTIRRYVRTDIALLSAVVLPMSMLWLEKASSSEIDTMLVMWVLAAWSCFLKVMESADTKWEWRWWMLALLCVAGGVLTKWTSFLFFYAMAIPTLLWHRSFWRLFAWPHLLAATVGVMVVLLWLAPVTMVLGLDNVAQMLWKEGAPRVIHSENGSSKLVLETVAHPFKVMGIALPWSLLALWLWFRSRHRQECLRQKILFHTLWAWAVVGTLMMTVFPDHNIRQSFSLVPALTLLGILYLSSHINLTWHTHRRWLIGIVCLWAIIKIVHVEVLIPARFAKRPDLDAQARVMQAFVAPQATLYLSRAKDECLMFHYGAPVRRLREWDQLLDATCYCVLTVEERANWSATSRIVAEQAIRDAQGETLVLVQLR
jgi:4-amino-4-deoxy-L-arabinose transferase-like glycosyltransferase